jgi:hypothetical protein
MKIKNRSGSTTKRPTWTETKRRDGLNPGLSFRGYLTGNSSLITLELVRCDYALEQDEDLAGEIKYERELIYRPVLVRKLEAEDRENGFLVAAQARVY